LPSQAGGFMKKICCVIVALFIGFSAFAEGNPDARVGVGFSLPFSNMEIEEAGSSCQTQVITPAVNVMVNAVFDSGFALRGVFDIGIPVSKDFKDKVFDYNNSVELFLDFGIGYAFIHTDNFSFCLFGMAGFSLARYTAETALADLSFFHFTLDAGADAVAQYNFNSFLSVYASFSFRYRFPLTSAYYVNDTLLNNDSSTSGMSFIPSFGIAFKL